MLKKKKIYPAYVSKHNSNRENQVIFSMIPNGEGCHYVVVKNLLELLRGITPKNNSGFYCLNCLHSFRTKNKLKSHKEVWKNKDLCNIITSSEDTKMLEFNQKVPFIIYAELECLIKKID